MLVCNLSSPPSESLAQTACIKLPTSHDQILAACGLQVYACPRGMTLRYQYLRRYRPGVISRYLDGPRGHTAVQVRMLMMGVRFMPAESG